MAEAGETSSTDSIASSAASSRPAVHIVYTERPREEDPKDFHIRTLTSVLGSEEAAKDALVYSYKTAASGFSAKLTPDQVSRISHPPALHDTGADEKSNAAGISFRRRKRKRIDFTDFLESVLHFMRMLNIVLLRMVLPWVTGEKEEETSRQLLVDELREMHGYINNCLTSKPNATGRKRKRVDSTNFLKKFLNEMTMHTIELQRIASLLTGEKEEETTRSRRKQVIDELREIPGLSIGDCIELFETLSGNVQKTNCFLSLPKNMKHEYCMDLLGRRS